MGWQIYQWGESCLLWQVKSMEFSLFPHDDVFSWLAWLSFKPTENNTTTGEEVLATSFSHSGNKSWWQVRAASPLPHPTLFPVPDLFTR